MPMHFSIFTEESQATDERGPKTLQTLVSGRCFRTLYASFSSLARVVDKSFRRGYFEHFLSRKLMR